MNQPEHPFAWWPDPEPRGDGLRLRALRRDTPDVAMVRDLATDAYVPQTGSLPGDATAPEAEAWIGRQLDRVRRRQGWPFCVARSEDDLPLGVVGVRPVDEEGACVELGWSVAPAHRGRGVASAAARLALGFAWGRPEVERVQAHVEPWNLASRSAAESAGLAMEGLLRRGHRIGGELRDVCLYAAVRADRPGRVEPTHEAGPDGTRVRPMERADWPRVSAIWAEGIATGHATFETAPPSWEQFDATRSPGLRWVAEDGHQVVGWAAASPVSSRAVYAGIVEHSIYVAEVARGRGVGRALLLALVRGAVDSGAWTVQSGVFPENVASLDLHTAAGFRVIGVRRRVGRMARGPLAGRWRDVVAVEWRASGEPSAPHAPPAI